MRRVESPPRSDWQQRVEAAGLTWHTAEQQPYWNESAFYEFSAKEVDLLAAATNELEEMTRKAAQHAIDAQPEFSLTENVAGLIRCGLVARITPAASSSKILAEGGVCSIIRCAALRCPAHCGPPAMS